MDLDVSRFPREALYGPADGKQVDLAQIVLGLRPTFDDWGGQGLIDQTDSFGFAMAKPDIDFSTLWIDPYQYVWFVAGWGPEGDRYIANAVRKLRPLLREGNDTLAIRQWLHGDRHFENVVNSQEPDGSFRWGDFPWGGATNLHMGNHELHAAVSCYKEVEDDPAAKVAAALVGMTMLKLDEPAKFDS